MDKKFKGDIMNEIIEGVNMTGPAGVYQIHNKRCKLELDISKLIRTFIDDTQMGIESITVSTPRKGGCRSLERFLVDLTITLKL